MRRIAYVVGAALFLGTAQAVDPKGIPTWTTDKYDPATWTAADNNILTSATLANDGLTKYSEGTRTPNQIETLTDGKVPPQKGDYTGVVGIKSGSIEWMLDGSYYIDGIRIYSIWGDGGRDGIAIDQVLYKNAASGDTWIEVVGETYGNAVSCGMQDNGSYGALVAKLAVADGIPFMEKATALKIVFSASQDNSGTGYAEVEATGARHLMPFLENAKIVLNDSGAFELSGTIGGTDVASVKALVWHADDEAPMTNELAGAEVKGAFFARALEGLAPNASYRVSVLLQGTEEDVEVPMGTVYNGEITIAAGGDANIDFGKKGTFVVSRDDSAAATAQPLTVKYAVTGGTAAVGTDFAAPSGEVTIPAGATSATIDVMPLLNMGAEEALSLELGLAEGCYAISSEAATAAISLLPSTGVWTYDATQKTISDGDWVLNVTENGGKLTVKGVAVQGDGVKVLNLGRPVQDLDQTSYTIVTIGEGAFTNNETIEEVYLPQTIVSFDRLCFRFCSALRTLQPLLPDSVTSLGECCFEGCPIEGDFRSGFGVDDVGGYSRAAFSGNHFTTVTLGPRFRTLSEGIFASSAKTLTSVTMTDFVTTWGSKPFGDCTSITNLTPCLPRDVASSPGWMALSGLSGLTGTLYVATGSKAWGLNSNDLASGTGFDTVVFGTNFTGAVNSRNQFTNMANLRHFRVLGDANFNFHPENSWSTLFDDKPYRLIVHVPADNESWIAVMNDPTQVTAWPSVPDEIKQKFSEYFPNERKPKGLIVANWSTYGASGTTLTLVNRWITDDTTDGSILVKGDPVNAGEPTIPYGTTKTSALGPSATCTIAENVPCGATLYRTTGYTVVYQDENGDQIGDAETVASLTYVFDATKGASVVLTWNFEPIAYRPLIEMPEIEGCSVTFSQDPDKEGFYAPDTTIDCTAVGDGFLRWFGDVSEDVAENRTISVTLNEAKTLKPYFSAAWVLSDDLKTMTDGYWTLNMSGTRDNLTVNGFSGEPIPLLNLRNPIVGGGSIKTISNGLVGAADTLCELTLPDTIEVFAEGAFKNFTKLRKVTPLLPDSVRTVNADCFNGCPIEGDLRLGFGPNPVGGYIRTFTGHHFRTIKLGPNAKTLFEGMFETSAGTLVSVELDEALETWGSKPFAGCTTVTNFTPNCFPKGLKNAPGWSALAGLTSLTGTLYVLTGDSTYNLSGCSDLANGTKYDTVVFGKNFSGEINARSMFVNMSNLRHFVFEGDAPIDCLPPQAWETIFDDKPYQLIVHVPHPDKNASWKAVLEDPAQVMPWGQLDDETKAKFFTYFPGEKHPYGLIVANWTTKTYADGSSPSGPAKTLVNRWITYAGKPGLTLILK